MMLEQTELRDAARDLLAGLGRASGAEALATLRDAGWLGLTLDEEQGGLGQPFAAATWLYLEIGRALSPAPLLSALLAAEALQRCPTSAERDTWLERVLGGDGPAVSLVTDNDLRIDGERISGRLSAVDGFGASHVLVASADLIALVPTGVAGVTITARPLWDTSRLLASIELGGAALTDATVLARGADAADVFARLSAHLHFAMAADCVGGADALLDETIAYLKTRRQFDRPLAMFQALKHRCADLKTAVSAAEALLADHVAVAQDGGGDALLLARGAKSIASETYRLVAEEAVQLHGGIGVTEEHPCHLYLKRALLNEQLASADDACDLAVGQALLRSDG